ncbi:DNA-processing protein DprA [Amycolatopsis acidiphila]|uniref:DNA-protecting protein DprA n=1 Tax=Amycolatopsis acidiphila TaxID=715473 RepID=A0A557ZMY8_9PSEU|nr:DNA-processing protein DprA [Amycolatopsis acidiphila]TVT13363.1 DNA-protecting protein DprA [Amycolatopsis acidiphila]UIJ63790.1 DNA-processing protein DprA [Amycolatopsis acidiphila]
MSMTDERLARAYLVRVAEPPAPALAAFVAEWGPIAAAEAVRKGLCPQRVQGETAARRELNLAEPDLEAGERIGARLIIPEDDEWPAWPLLCLDVARGRGVQSAAVPLALWARGDARLDEAAEAAVAIVGARAASGYGEHVAGEFAYGLAQRELSIFSGAAYGIDGAAHRGALAADGVTVALLGCGLDAGYPAGHVVLLNKIAEQGGLVVSEYPPGTPPARHRFLVRNRLIAALSEGTVVVEAGRRSGARNTATTAGALGKIVMAVPGPISSAMSTGCHDLIRNSAATLVGSVDDVIDIVGKLGTRTTERLRPRRRTDGLGADALRVHEALGRGQGKSAEQVATESGVPVPRVRAVLPALELEGLAERGESGWQQCRAVRKTQESA